MGELAYSSEGWKVTGGAGKLNGNVELRDSLEMPPASGAAGGRAAKARAGRQVVIAR